MKEELVKFIQTYTPDVELTIETFWEQYRVKLPGVIHELLADGIIVQDINAKYYVTKFGSAVYELGDGDEH